MYIAQYFARVGLDKRAMQLVRQVATLEPLRHEACALGLRLARQSDDLDAIRWATLGVISQAWPSDQVEVQREGVRLAKATLARMRAEGPPEEADRYERQLAEALARDCLVRVSWTGDADVDLMVEEPTGTVCSLRNSRTASGGVMLGDGYSRVRPSSSGVSSESYVCPKGFAGTYRVLLRRVWGKVTAGKVTVDVYCHLGTKGQKHERRQIPVGSKDAVVVFDLDGGRLTAPLAQHQIARAASDQVAINRSILAQQLNSMSDPAPVPVRPNFTINPQLLVGRGAVGFQPVITVLPVGRNFIATAVISADRRYVRTSPTFIVSDVTNVETFTFAGTGQAVDTDMADQDMADQDMADAGTDVDALDADMGEDLDANAGG
jgi:hypothetical protein